MTPTIRRNSLENNDDSNPLPAYVRQASDSRLMARHSRQKNDLLSSQSDHGVRYHNSSFNEIIIIAQIVDGKSWTEKILDWI